MSTGSDKAQAAYPQAQPETIKETLISIVIAFALAFVFRGFVVEAFVIPTGSMAPTLMGAHMRFQGRDTGYSWPVGPNSNQVSQTDRTPTGPDLKKVMVTDPISGEVREHASVRVQSGDRILVLKYLYAIQEPERFDVIVFKNPTNPQENYIKRLIGLPGEQIALVDGDVFTRPITDPAADPGTLKSWDLPGWTIARKGQIQQQAVWQLIFDSSLAPLSFAPGSEVAKGPWEPGEPKGWEMQPRRYVHAGPERAELTYVQTRARDAASAAAAHRRPLAWAINDFYPYNETSIEVGQFPVGDLRARAAIVPRGAGLSAAVRFTVKSHDFEAVLAVATVNIRQRAPQGAAGIMGDWKDVATAPFDGFTAGVATNIEVWHQDQSVQVWVNGRLAVRFDYDWSPAQRILYATGKPLSEWMAGQTDARNVLANPRIYETGAIKDLRWVMQGAGFEMFRVGVDRDLYYQPANFRGDTSARATNPETTLALGPDQFFVCGDNSPASLDGRLWEASDEWVVREFPAPPGGLFGDAGVVPRDLLLGRAFFVYWPSLKYEGKPTPVPDFGRMRMIW